MADTVPNGGVLPGPRSYQWQPLAPATVAWAEALDNGDPRAKVPHRDKVMTLAAPFTAAPAELTRIENRFAGVAWTDSGAALRHRERTAPAVDAHVDHRQAGRSAAQALGSQSGRFVRQSRHAAPPRRRVRHVDDSSERRRHLPRRHRRRARGLASVRRSPEPDDAQERSALPDDRPAPTRPCSRCFPTTARRFSRATRRSTEPPNVYVRDLKANTRRAITNYADPAPSLRGMQKQLVTYKRSDGVELSATLITPPGWTPAQGRLPTLLWAYPREFTDPNNAGQVTSSPNRYTAHRRRVAPALPDAGLRDHRRSDDADRRTRGDGQRHLRAAARRERAGGRRPGRRAGRHRSRSRRRRRPQLRRRS